MDYCKSCGNELIVDAVFCTKCGTKVEGKSVKDSTETVQTDDSAVNNDEIKEKLSSTFSNAKTAVESNGYFNYIKETAKLPTAAIDSNKTNNGWIQMAIFALTATFGLYAVLRSALLSTMRSFGGGVESLFGVDNFAVGLLNDIVPNLFIGSVLLYLIFVGSAFVTLKVTTKTEKSFTTLLTEFGGLFTPNILIFGAVGIISLLLSSAVTSVLGLVLISFSFLLCFAAYNFYLYNRANVERLDKMYVLLISNLSVLILIVILITILLEPLLTVIMQLENMI